MLEIQKGTEWTRERRTGAEKRKRDSDRTNIWRGKDTYGGPETKPKGITMNNSIKHVELMLHCYHCVFRTRLVAYCNFLIAPFHFDCIEVTSFVYNKQDPA